MGKKERPPDKREMWLASVIGRFVIGFIVGVCLWTGGCCLECRYGLDVRHEWLLDPVRFLFFTLGCGSVAVILPDEFFRRLSGDS